MEGPIVAIFMKRVSFEDAPEPGRALTYRQVIGVSLTDGDGTDAAIAHELGHLSGLGDAKGTEKDAAGKPMFDVMVQHGPGVHPTAAECANIRPWADKSSRCLTSFRKTTLKLLFACVRCRRIELEIQYQRVDPALTQKADVPPNRMLCHQAA
jgi:hypothetical protein